MLFESLGQGWIFLLFLHIGLCCAIIDELPRFIPNIKFKKPNKKNKTTSNKNKKITFITKVAQKNKSNFKYKIILKNCLNIFIDFIRVIFCFAIFYISVLLFNYGEIRFYLILAFGVGFWLERTFLATAIKKLWQKVYNHPRGDKNENKVQI